MNINRLKSIIKGKIDDTLSELDELVNYCDEVLINSSDDYDVGKLRGALDILIDILDMLEEEYTDE